MESFLSQILSFLDFTADIRKNFSAVEIILLFFDKK